MHTSRILFVVTSARRVEGVGKDTGSWLEEVAAPYYTFTDAKCAVTIASPLGGAAPVDAESLEETHCTASTRRFEADAKAQHALAHTAVLSSVDFSQYDAVYFAGGHGTIADFPVDASVRALVANFYAAGKPIAAVCHGPACFVGAVKVDGQPVIAGHRFTCFTDEEETLVGLAGAVPFLLETTLRAQGGKAEQAAPFTRNVVIDGPIFTGQNPASAIALAEAVIHQLRQQQPQLRAA